MKYVLSNLGFAMLSAAALLAISLAVETAAATRITFAGKVTHVGGDGAVPPSVGVGDPVTCRIDYSTVLFGRELGPSHWEYVFDPTFALNRITVVIGSHEWQSYELSAEICNELCDGDSFSYLGLSRSNFLGLLDVGVLLVEFSDSEAPYDLLDGYDLPDTPADIQFAAAQLKSGQVNSSNTLAFWWIVFDVDSLTVPVRATTWSEIKLLYARP